MQALAADPTLCQTSTPPAPLIPYPESEPMPTGLTASHLKYLSRFLSASYLSASNLERLAGQFVEGSEVVMHNFLNAEVAARVKAELQTADEQYTTCNGRIPPQDFGISDDWELQGPASKHRFLGLSADAKQTTTPALQSLLTELYPSTAFRAWLQVVSSLVVLSHACEARRFRKGLDYTLASGEGADGQPRLDGTLGLTWWGAYKEQDGEDEQDVGAWEASLFLLQQLSISANACCGPRSATSRRQTGTLTRPYISRSPVISTHLSRTAMQTAITMSATVLPQPTPPMTAPKSA